MFLPKKGANRRASSYPKISLEMSTNQKEIRLKKISTIPLAKTPVGLS